MNGVPEPLAIAKRVVIGWKHPFWQSRGRKFPKVLRYCSDCKMSWWLQNECVVGWKRSFLQLPLPIQNVSQEPRNHPKDILLVDGKFIFCNHRCPSKMWARRVPEPSQRYIIGGWKIHFLQSPVPIQNVSQESPRTFPKVKHWWLQNAWLLDGIAQTRPHFKAYVQFLPKENWGFILRQRASMRAKWYHKRVWSRIADWCRIACWCSGPVGLRICFGSFRFWKTSLF